MRQERLTQQERDILDFEQERGRHLRNSEKATEIRRRFGLSTIRYHQVLYGLLDRRAAEAYAPVTVHRLRRIVADRERRLAG